MGEAAQAAHEGGDYLGTFVFMLCHEQGRAFRSDKTLRWKLNHQLRQQLEKTDSPSPLQRFVLAQLSPADEHGVVDIEGHISNYQDQQRGLRQKHLESAADAGLAEACNRLGLDCQEKRDYKQAYEWFERAARTGLAAGLRNQSFLLSKGLGIKKDEKLALELAARGAEAGDCMSRINLAMHHEKGWGTAQDSATARKHVDLAASTGHWMGHLEKGFALHMGNYGFDVNHEAGNSEFQKALDTRNREVLETLSQVYAQGHAVERNEQLAADMATAAFVLGSQKVARLLSYLHSRGIAQREPEKEAVEFWKLQSTPTLWPLAGADSPYRRRLEKIDPWATKIP